MLNLLKIEWLKMKNYKTFWILSGLYVIAVFGVNVIVYNIKMEVDKADPMLKTMLSTPFNYPQVWHSVSWLSTWLLYFPGFIMIFLITNEYTFRTHRQNVIDGWSRRQFVVVKLFLGLVLAIVSTLFMTIAALVFGALGSTAFSLDNSVHIFYFFVTACIYILFAMMLAFLFRRAALAVGVFFIYGLIFDNLLSGLINNRTQSPLGDYLMPLQVADSIIPVPFLAKFAPYPPVLVVSLIIAIVWIIAYHVLMIWKFEREDL